MKSLRQFPGRHLVNRIDANLASVKDYIQRWERDQRVARAVCLLHFEKGLSYREISEWLRGGKPWARRTEDQVRGIITSARRDYRVLAGDLAGD